MWVESVLSFIRTIGSILGSLISFLVSCSDLLDKVVVFIIGPRYSGDMLGEWIYALVGALLWLVFAILCLFLVFVTFVYTVDRLAVLISAVRLKIREWRGKYEA